MTVTFRLPADLNAELLAVRRYFVHLAMKATDGNMTEAARLLSIPRKSMVYHVKDVAEHWHRVLWEEVENGLVARETEGGE